MAKLHFNYAAMNSGKSTDLLRKAFSYKERGHEVLYLTSSLDTRYHEGKITSRIGIESDAFVIKPNSLFELDIFYDEISRSDYKAVFVDECQFLTKEQVDKLAEIVDNLNVDVFCYGLRTDFTGNLFEGSKHLIEVADELEDLSSICDCGNKAIMTARLVSSTEQVLIGGNEAYKSMCRKCHKQHMRSKT
ncbi:thymidine kinase [Salmonella phage SE_PL]|uniref:thymidine kinase n=1 Tax=Salmonella enterica TaxID=28901 RepID=UPI000FDFA6AD|nr:thymidine kinase [Salmonella phage Munch]EAZ2022987.1 thymidine kinase [Salmonella enterica]ECV9084122.1 thymidine kinase [Salmonella enterica subsp. enterica serovar Infantis]MCP0435777.1 thymidine kinase [Salmonella enterica subsp. enterica serovar Mbandaka]QCW18885.1 thymidine kinase [Salmonella phage 7t3]QIG62840.1 thymidine kinase [Salmonella phage SE_PL]WNV47307.1 thymidine kinase [Klebsiella phage fENko-Kae01]